MSKNIQYFFKENNQPKKNVFYVASSRFKDEDGKPIEWELRQVPTELMEDIKDRTNFYGESNKIMGRFAIEAIVASVVYPPLRKQELQDSYGVKNPEDLLYKLLNTAELDMLKVKVMDVNGYGEDFEALAGEAKNS